jgi:hypothetical protein
VADLLISRVAPGVAAVSSVDPFDTLEIYRIDRARWQHTPERPGIYLLYGVTAEGKLTVYIGMSTTNMRSRIRTHHINPAKNWFGVLFAVPVASSLLCPAIEAELIGQDTEAGVVDVIANEATETRHRGADDVHVEPAVDKIRDGLQLVLGSDIFTPDDDSEPQTTDPPIARMAASSRVRGPGGRAATSDGHRPARSHPQIRGSRSAGMGTVRSRRSRQTVPRPRGKWLAQTRAQPRGDDL